MKAANVLRLVFAILFVCINVKAKQDATEDYFENLQSEEREVYLRNLRVSSAKFANQSHRIDVVDELNEGCHGFASYTRESSSGRIVIPEVRCHYVADDSLDGMTPKFKCKFKNINGESKKLKVKYANGLGATGKEIATAIIGPSMARFMGFKADTYCPVRVVCEGCSRDPWSKENGQNHSSGPALKDVENHFDYALIEMKIPGWKLSEPRNGARKPLGFEWDEMRMVDESLPQGVQDQIRIEREAYMLWINFIYHTDADAHNNRLVCEELDQNSSHLQKPVCGIVTGYAHDYGDSFRRFDLNSFINTPTFFTAWNKSAPLSSWGAEGNRCVGTMGGGEGAISNAVFSEEARLLFLKYFSLITDTQLADLLALAQVDAIGSQSSIADWIYAIRNKITEVTAKKCSPYIVGESVLHR